MAAITSNGTGGGNWSAGASWTGAAVPIEGDTVIVQNGDTITIGQDITVGADTTTAAIDVASGGKLEVLSTVAASYTLTCKGDLKTSSGGTIEFGTVANPIPSTRTFTIKLNYSASLVTCKYGLINNGTMIMQGASKTSHTLLTSDLSATGTVWTVGNTTGWEVGDNVAIASTSRTYTEHEQEVIQSVDSGTQITCVAGVTHAHSGTSPSQAEVINLNRNIKITAYNTSYNGYIYLPDGGITDCDYVEFSELGTAATTKYGIEIRTTGVGDCNISYCSIYNSYEVYLTDAQNVITNDSTIYNSRRLFHFSTTDCSNTNIVCMGSSIYNYFTNCTRLVLDICSFNSGASYGIYIQDSTVSTMDNIVAHSNNNYGVRLNNVTEYITINTISVWKNISSGCDFNLITGLIDGGTFFENDYAHIFLDNCAELTFKNFAMNGVGYTDYAMDIASCYGSLRFENVSMGKTTVHLSADLSFYTDEFVQITMINCYFGSAVEVEYFDETTVGSFIQSEDHDEIQYNDKAWYTNGIVVRDSSTYKYGSYSTRFDFFYNQGTWLNYETYIPVKDSEQIVASAWLRKNASYTDSNRPKLTISGQGITEDVVQMSDVTDTWERVTVTGTPTRTGLAKLTISTYLVNAGASAWADFQKTDIMSGVLNTIEGDFWANGHIAEVFMDTGSITAVEFWSTLTADVNTTASFGKLLKNYIDAAISGRAPANEYDTQIAYIPSDLSDVPTDSELDAAHGSGSWEGTTPADVADAVWDELEAGHTVAGSFGEEVTKQGKKLDRNLVWLLP